MEEDAGGLILYLGEHAIHLPAAIIGVFLIAFAATFLVLRKLTARHRGCPWKRVRNKSRPPFTTWLCASCSVEAFSMDGRRPKECKRPLKPVM